jgi:hypothetical protein
MDSRQSPSGAAGADPESATHVNVATRIGRAGRAQPHLVSGGGGGGARLVGSGIEVVDREVVADLAAARAGVGSPTRACLGRSSLTSGECQVTHRRWHRPRPLPVSAPATVTAAVAAVIAAVEAPVERVVAVVGIYGTGRGVVELSIARRLALAP